MIVQLLHNWARLPILIYSMHIKALLTNSITLNLLHILLFLYFSWLIIIRSEELPPGGLIVILALVGFTVMPINLLIDLFYKKFSKYKQFLILRNIYKILSVCWILAIYMYVAFGSTPITNPIMSLLFFGQLK